MEIYPAIDIINGKCVRLQQGKFEQETSYDITPLDYAKKLAAEGAKWIHIVDLDGAKQGSIAQKDIIRKIAKGVAANIQVGGGVNTANIIAELLGLGVARVVIGSKAVSDPQTVSYWIERFKGDRITLAFDVLLDNSTGDYRAAVKGWKELSPKSLWDMLNTYKDTPVFNVLCTDIGKDGMLSGPSTELYKRILAEYPGIRLQASGGVSSLEDLSKLKTCGASAVIIGKALYEKKFTLQEAIAEVTRK
jgi:phosphoribosylformimino-5-aminoimidazole carboxamide ribotide isomerase